MNSTCRENLNLQQVDKCPICKGSRLGTVGKTRTIHPDADLQVGLMECANCFHWFISPSLTQNELMQLYENGSEYVVSGGWQPDKKVFTIPEKYIIQSEFRNPKKQKKYLEIGIGQGLLFNHFRSVGYDCFGVEPGPWAQGTKNVVKDIADLNQVGFDVVVIADVLEHIEDPLSFIKTIGSLVDTGTVYACFPNSQSLRARVSKEKWRMVRPLGHLHFFSEESLLLMFELSGLRVKRLITTDLIDFFGRSLFNPVYLFPVNLFLSLTQRFWGDQWIVQLEK